jgi:phosphatidylglycerophosphate synthase
LLKLGVKPNQVSVMSVVFAAGAAACLIWGVPSGWAWLGAAVCVQMRLVCNLMDGMLAVEGGLKSPSGDLYNEFPDRLADTFILAGLGAAGGTALAGGLGWVAACGALITACVRMHGASLTGAHDFRGPMAKPHRMALVTGVCVLMAVSAGLGGVLSGVLNVVEWALVLMVTGIVVTLWRRLNGLSRALHERAKGVVK